MNRRIDHTNDREDQRRHQQAWVEERDEHDRDDALRQGVDQQVDARAEHGAELADVVGAAGHEVADPLPVVERLALAEQADVELVAGAAFHPPGQHLGAKPGKQVETATQQDDHEQRDNDSGEHLRRVGRLGAHGVEGAADQPRDGGVERDHDHRAGQEAGEVPRVAQLVRQDPARRAPTVVPMLVGDRELGLDQGHRAAPPALSKWWWNRRSNRLYRNSVKRIYGRAGKGFPRQFATRRTTRS
jgi:hypothetical protein